MPLQQQQTQPSAEKPLPPLLLGKDFRTMRRNLFRLLISGVGLEVSRPIVLAKAGVGRFPHRNGNGMGLSSKMRVGVGSPGPPGSPLPLLPIAQTAMYLSPPASG